MDKQLISAQNKFERLTQYNFERMRHYIRNWWCVIISVRENLSMGSILVDVFVPLAERDYFGVAKQGIRNSVSITFYEHKFPSIWSSSSIPIRDSTIITNVESIEITLNMRWSRFFFVWIKITKKRMFAHIFHGYYSTMRY